jgi:hypothetical protein
VRLARSMCDVEMRLRSGSPMMGVGIAATTCDDGRNQSETVGAWLRVLLHELREVHIRAEVFLNRRDVAFEAISPLPRPAPP